MSTERPTRRRPDDPDLTAEELSAHLKERIYGAFACLTTLLVLVRHPHHGSREEAWSALADVAIALISLWAASLFAEILAHMASHGGMPHGREWVLMVRSSWQIVSSGIFPMFLLLLAGVGAIGYGVALNVSVGVVIVTLGLFAMLAARRTDLPQWKRLLLSAVLMGIGALVVLLKYLAH